MIKHSRSQKLIDCAFYFAEKAHKGQKRKYTGEPYIVHPLAVAEIVASVTDDADAICAALLHDTIEDTIITYEDIISNGFGYRTARLVLELTEFSLKHDGNRQLRKDLDARYLARATPLAKTIKLADLIDNSASIVKYDTDFARIYLREKALLLAVLTDGDSTLHARASEIVRRGLSD